MGRLKLCFGIKVDAGEWGKALGIKYGEGKAKTCDFCGNDNPKTNNFCGNCGSNLKRAVCDVSSADIVEFTLTRLGRPPSPVELLPGKNCIYMCQVLAVGDVGFASFPKPIERFNWNAVERAIVAYADMPDMKGPAPCIFAMDEEIEKQEKTK